MDNDKKDTIVTTLRLPKHLHHKLLCLSEAEERSLQGLMLMVLQDHIIDLEQDMYDVYGTDEFEVMYRSVFGSSVMPYINIEDKGIALTPKDVLNQIRGAQRSPQSNTGTYARDKNGYIKVRLKDQKDIDSDELENMDVDKLLE